MAWPRPAPAGRRLGGRLPLDEVPAADGATLDEALGGGEDYELLLAVDARESTPCPRLRRGGLRLPARVGR